MNQYLNNRNTYDSRKKNDRLVDIDVDEKHPEILASLAEISRIFMHTVLWLYPYRRLNGES